ncbi:MAG TPA: thioredoxin-dependent thiol peroxidase [Candidatus Alistipes pullicola]|nr:thioredoxin-dependent thiol peroxidase [Candidatus Alistipes pullicola]
MATHLKIGDKAPAFEAPDQNGETRRLSDYAGKKLILYFYPKDNTPGCTAEACSLRDGRAVLQERGFEVVGVSPDTVQSHQRFIAKKELNFTLLSDPEHRVAEAYGVWGEKKFMGRVSMGILRTTFVIGTDGVIEKVFEKVRTADHFQQILEAYE